MKGIVMHRWDGDLFVAASLYIEPQFESGTPNFGKP